MTDSKDEADEVQQFIAAVKLLEDAGWSVKRPSPAPAESGTVAQCCMCGKRGLSTVEDGGPECELGDGRWVCSQDCYDRAVPSPAPSASVGRVTEAMIEAAARALAEDHGKNPDRDIGAGYVEWHRYLSLASHALKAAIASPPDHGGGEGE